MNQSQENLFQAVFIQLSAPSVILKTDAPRFTIVHRNLQHEIATNTVGQNLAGKGAFEVFNPKDPDRQSEFHKLMGGITQSIENKNLVKLPPFRFDILIKDGDRFEESWWQVEIMPIIISETVDYLMVSSYNVTEKILDSHAVVRSQDKATKLSEELTVTNEALSATNEEMAASTEHMSQLKNREAELYDKMAVLNEELESANEELKASFEEISRSNSQLKSVQNNLQDLNKELESRVAERTADFETAKKDTETQRERLYRLLMEAPAGICIASGPDLVFELINPLYQQFFPGRHLLNKPVLEAIPEIKDQPIYDVLKNVYATGKPFEGRELLVPMAREENGTIEDRFFNFIYQPRYNTIGVIDGIMVFAYEVTDEINTRKKTEENEKLFGQVLESMPQISWTNEPDGEVDFYNQRWYEYTGLDFESTKRWGWKQVIHPDDLDYVINQYAGSLQSGNDFKAESRFKRHDGTYRWHLSRGVPLKNEKGEIGKWVGTATDIDDLKQLQQQKEEFISIASHELKTPLTSLRGSLQILDRVIKKESDTPHIITQMVNSSINHLKKVSNLVNDLLSSTKIEQGQLVLHKTWFTVADLVNNCCDHVRMDGIFGLITRGDTELKIYGDEHKLDQVLVNFVNNAVKYAPDSKEIILSIEKVGNFAKVAVQDFGAGIPEEKLPHLFDRFFRADHSGSQYSGLGLGLYICQQIIEKHNGEIGVESIAGKGSTFWFKVPIS